MKKRYIILLIGFLFLGSIHLCFGGYWHGPISGLGPDQFVDNNLSGTPPPDALMQPKGSVASVPTKPSAPAKYVCNGTRTDAFHDECTPSITAQDVYNMETDVENRTITLESEVKDLQDKSDRTTTLQELGGIVVLFLAIGGSYSLFKKDK